MHLLEYTLPFSGGHTVDFAGVVGSKYRAVRDQICTTHGPQVDCVRQVDFDERVVRHRAGWGKGDNQSPSFLRVHWSATAVATPTDLHTNPQ